MSAHIASKHTPEDLRQIMGTPFGTPPQEAQSVVSLDGGLIDARLKGGLMRGAVHEIAPCAGGDIAAALGFVLGAAVRARGEAGHVLYIQHRGASHEAGMPYALGLEAWGLATRSVIYLRAPRLIDVLWAMEEALKAKALAAVVAEVLGEERALDLNATRRLALAAREGGLGLLLRHGPSRAPSAAATRWSVRAASSEEDDRAVFRLELVRNRFGPCGAWTAAWNQDDKRFDSKAVSLDLARTSADRPDRAQA